MARPGELEGGQESPKFTEPPLALEFLKIAMHCRHFRNLLVMFSKVLSNFQSIRKEWSVKIMLRSLSAL